LRFVLDFSAGSSSTAFKSASVVVTSPDKLKALADIAHSMKSALWVIAICTILCSILLVIFIGCLIFGAMREEKQKSLRRNVSGN
jgi:hypothetical protein